MGAALASAALQLGHEVVIVSGPVTTVYPAGARVVSVVTTDEMLKASQQWFAECDGAIGVAAPCDYMPQIVETEKIAKTGAPLTLQLIETPDVVATLGQTKRDDQWVVGFALETNDRRNGPIAMDSDVNDVELLDTNGEVIARVEGNKQKVADVLMREIDRRLIRKTPASPQ